MNISTYFDKGVFSMLFHEGYVWFEAKEKQREAETKAKRAWMFYERQEYKRASKSLSQQTSQCCVCICEA